MQVPDVNIYIYAHRAELPEHERYADLLRDLVGGDSPVGVSELALFGFVRIVTNRKAFKTPTPLAMALKFVDVLLDQPNALRLRPGPAHWRIFARLCLAAGATGKLSADAHHAALCLEHGGELITADSDFARFKGLRWRHPFAGHD